MTSSARLSARPTARLLATAATVLACVGASLSPALADSGPGKGGGGNGGGHGNGHGGGNSVTTIPLPNGFAPEDITAGRRHTFYVGSLTDGSIYQGSFRSTTGSVLVTGAGTPTTGLYYEDRHRGRNGDHHADNHADNHADDHGHHHNSSDDRHGSGSHRRHDRLWAAGGPSGEARVYDASTGALLNTWHLAAANSGSFISDVIVTRDAAYYTDAFKPFLYVIDLRGDDAGTVRTVPLTGAVVYQSPGFNLNGLAVYKKLLVSAQTVTGNLYSIDPSTGLTTQIPLVDKQGNPVTVPGGDGIAQRGKTLYIAQNIPNRLATVKLTSHLRGARLISQVTSTLLDVPSSVEEDRGRLYALNARFTTSPRDASTTYNVVQVGKKN